MKIHLTESELRKYIRESVEEISTQLKTNAMFGAFDKSRKAHENGNAGLTVAKNKQGERFYNAVVDDLNTMDSDSKRRIYKLFYKDDTVEINVYIDPYTLQTGEGKVRGVVSLLPLNVDTCPRQSYIIIYDVDDHTITSEKESGNMEQCLNRVSENGVRKYNQAKKKVRDLILGYANRKNGPVSQYTVGNDGNRYDTIGDAMRASVKGGKNIPVSKVQPIK